MSERYSKLFNLPENLYVEGSPVVISAGALLKDNMTDNILAQLKIKSISDLTIKAATVKIKMYDTKGTLIDGEKKYQYLDLNVSRNVEFGQQVPIILPDRSARSFSATVMEIIFADNSVWENEKEDWESIPKQELLMLEADVLEQYMLEFGDKCIYKLQEEKDLIICSCGTINKGGDVWCAGCCNNLDKIKNIDFKGLKERAEIARKDEILAEATEKMSDEWISSYRTAIELLESISGWKDADEKIEICKRKIEEKLERNTVLIKKTKKIASIVLPSVAGLVIIIVLMNTLIIPAIKYNSAKNLMSDGIYEEAICAFEAMGDYKDSKNKIDECKEAQIEKKYKKAINLMDKKKYYDAITTLKKLDGYKDSEKKIKKCNEAISEGKYKKATALMNEGDNEAAYVIFDELAGYKDSSEKATNIRIQQIKENCSVGSYIKFGKYEQDYNDKNGKEEIEWLVLDKKGGRVLVISKFGLDCKSYDTKEKDVTWETCTLREWLNNNFLNTAFTEEEKAFIPTITITADENPDHNTIPGNATADKIFLLSIKESRNYFSSNENGECKPTRYAYHNGAWRTDSGNCWWWLRTPGIKQKNAVVVHLNGSDYVDGIEVNYDDCVVRPAMWIDLNS